MYCCKCGFITKGKDLLCPYCGSKYQKEKKLDKRIVISNWLNLTILQIIKIIVLNLFFAISIIEYFLYLYKSINYHLCPWIFLLFSFAIFLLSVFFSSSNSNHKNLWIKLMLISVIFGILSFFSYYNQNLFGIKSSLLIIGLFYPISFLIIQISCVISKLINKKYDAIKIILEIIVFFCSSLVLLMFDIANLFNIQSTMFSNVLIIANFTVSFFIMVNMIALLIIGIRSNFSTLS